MAVTAKPLDKEILDTMVGHWHSKLEFYSNAAPGSYRSSLIVCGTITGCGLSQMWGLSLINFKSLKTFHEILLQIKAAATSPPPKPGNHRPSGIIIGTLGHAFWGQCHKSLLQLGFVQLAEYRNTHPVHGKNDKQRLYLLDVENIPEVI